MRNVSKMLATLVVGVALWTTTVAAQTYDLVMSRCRHERFLGQLFEPA